MTNLSLHEAVLLSIAGVAPHFPADQLSVPVLPGLLPTHLLRDYQLEMLLECARLMREGYRRILLVLPTGGGKTVMASAMLGSAAQQNMSSQFIVHRKELIEQTSLTFTRSALDHAFIASGYPISLDALITLAGVQTLANRLSLVLPPNLAVIDEAHHATATTWARVMDAYDDSFIVGLTATPERLDGRGLKEHFDVMVLGPSPGQLIARGFLSPFSYYAPSIPDMTGVPTNAGDYQRRAAAALMDRPKLIGDIVEHYLRLAGGKQGIGFAVSREHSRNITDAFNAHGVRTVHVDGDMADKERARAVDAFKAGDIDMMSNVDLFGEGFDVPNIVYCGLWRPTKSIALLKQQQGRALRVFEGKTEAVICDHAGNAIRLSSLPDDDRTWSLEGRSKRAGSGAGSDASPIRQCLNCYRVSPSTFRACPGCGVEFPSQVREVQTKAGTLTKLEREQLKKAASERRKDEERACRSFQEFYELAVARGYDYPKQWANRKIAMRSGYRGR